MHSNQAFEIPNTSVLNWLSVNNLQQIVNFRPGGMAKGQGASPELHASSLPPTRTDFIFLRIWRNSRLIGSQFVSGVSESGLSLKTLP
jgi:hypothetical protein